MFIILPRSYLDALTRQRDDLERRVKRLEVMMLDDAQSKGGKDMEKQIIELIQDNLRTVAQSKIMAMAALKQSGVASEIEGVLDSFRTYASEFLVIGGD